MKFNGELDGVKWETLAAENPKLYAQIKPYVNRGRVTFLPDNNAADVLRWVSEQHAKQRAAEAVVKAKADEAERHRKAVAERDARHRAEFLQQHGAEVEQASRYAGLQRLKQYAEERGLARDPENARIIVEWCTAHGGLNPDNVDKAIVALSSQLSWSSFASRLRA